MQILHRIILMLDGLAEILGRIAAVFAPLMLLVTCYVVITRYVFNSGSVAIQDLVTYFNALIFILGAGYTLKHNAHVRVDIFYGHASARTQAFTNLMGTLLLLFPVAFFILYICWHYVMSSWAIHEASPDTGGLPYVYLLKSLILVLGAVLLTQGVAEIFRSVLILLGYSSPPTSSIATTIKEDNLL